MLVLTAAAGTGIYFMGNKTKTADTELAYVSRVSSMDPFSGIQRMAGVVEPQKTWEVQKNPEREVKEILVKTGDTVYVYSDKCKQTGIDYNASLIGTIGYELTCAVALRIPRVIIQNGKIKEVVRYGLI